jgi:hypothetical protein
MRRFTLHVALTLAASAGPVHAARSAVADVARAGVDVSHTRLEGLRVGPYAVGFEVRTGIDAERRINKVDAGTRIGMAIWYPAQPATRPIQALTTLDYRLLAYAKPLVEPERRAIEADEVQTLRAWRHVGIVDMTPEQARASLATHGVGVRGLPPASGRFPIVMMLGGQHYLSTTAELLASHGFLVVAAFRFVDEPDDIGTRAFTWYLENSVRDAEWALNVIRQDPRADARQVAAIGHGGGGIQALLLAMRNRHVAAVANIDAGNFSTRSRAREIPFYSPRLLRVPYLYAATAETRKGQDLFEDFLGMRFSERFEVTLGRADVRHNDLSDLGRGVTAPLAIRGAAQADVQRTYADVHELVVRFLQEYGAGRLLPDEAFKPWAERQRASGAYALTVHPRVEPAPTTLQVMGTLSRTSAVALREAHRVDPDGDVFQVSNLSRVIRKAVATRDLETAGALADFAVELHGTSAVLQQQRSQVLEDRGQHEAALACATACAALEAGQDWRAGGAIAQCRERVERLTKGAAGRR